MSTIKQALQHIAKVVPEARVPVVALLRQMAACDCGDEMIAGDLDEMFAGRAYTTLKGPDGAENRAEARLAELRALASLGAEVRVGWVQDAHGREFGEDDVYDAVTTTVTFQG